MDSRMDERQFEDALERLPHIRRVQVVMSDGGRGRITDIRVISDTSKEPKQVVRDVETVLGAVFGVNIDHRIVTVVQWEGEIGTLERPQKLSDGRGSIDVGLEG